MSRKIGSGKYGVPVKLPDGSCNSEYYVRRDRARGVGPRKRVGDNKVGIPSSLPDGRKNPEYGHRWYILEKPRQIEASRIAVWKKLGLNIEEAQRIYNSSNKCKICKEPISGKNKHLDHDHKTMKIRGVLCSKCNNGLGNFKDSIEI